MINVSSTAPVWTGGNTFPFVNTRDSGLGVVPLTIDQTTKPLRFGDDMDMWPKQPHFLPHEVSPVKGSAVDNEFLRRWISQQQLKLNTNGERVSEFRVMTVGERLVVAIDIPGVKKGTVEVALDGAVISVACERADTRACVNAKYTVPREYSVSPEDIEAWHDDGVLSIAFTRISQGRVKIGVR